MHLYNAHEALSSQPQIVYISRPCLFLHIYDPFSSPCLAVYLLFAKACEVFTAIHKHVKFGSHIWP